MPPSRLTTAGFLGPVLLALTLLIAPAARGAETARPGAPMHLFKVVSLKDDIVIGFGPADAPAVGGEPTPDTVADALENRHQLGAWLYGPRRGADGQPVMAPLRRIAVLVGAVVRIEAYTSDQPVVAPEK